MKRTVAFILSILLALSCLAACSGIGNNNIPQSSVIPVTDNTPDTDTIQINLAEYTVIRNANQSEELKASITELKKSIDKKCGANIGYSEDWLPAYKTQDADEKEIIIGNTDRTASSEALASLKGSCFTVRLVGSRIVIIGTDEDKTNSAIDYFIENYLSLSDNGIITVPNQFCYTSESITELDIIKNNTSSYKIVTANNLDRNKKETDNYDRYDCEVQWGQEIIETVNTLAKSSADIITPRTDLITSDTPAYLTEFEILIGNVDRPELEPVISKLGINEFTVCASGNKIIVFGWNYTTLKLAVDKLKALIQSGLSENDDGTVNLKIASDYSYIGSTDIWLTDIPQFDGGNFVSSYDANNGFLCMLYEKSLEVHFTAYCVKLENNGYTLLQKNKNAGNCFATYTKGDNYIHVYYMPFSSTVRILTSKNVELLPRSTPQNVTKICDMSITQMILDYASGNFGMCYIITLEDGSFVIYDGGGNKGNDAVRLYNVLTKLNKRSDGIHIAAWILTHAHQDHYTVYKNFINTYGNKVTLELFVSNSPGFNEMYNSRNYDLNGRETLPNLARSMGADVLTPFTGQYFYVRNIKFEVLYSHEALFPNAPLYFNNFTMVTRMTVQNQTITFLGDIQTEGSRVLYGMYGSTLKSDIVQVAHHGESGATREVYNALKPDVLLWPASSASYAKQTNPSSTSGAYKIDYYISTSLGVKKIYVAGETNKTLPLPFNYATDTVTEFQ